MWNDEDNNPYGTSFDRRDSQSSSTNPASPTVGDCKLSRFPRVLVHLGMSVEFKAFSRLPG